MKWMSLGDKGAVLLWGMVLLVLIAAVGVASVAAAGEAADWPQFQKDENNNGYTYEEAPLGVNFAWRAELSGAIDVEPLVVGDDVIVFVRGNYVYSLNKTTGVQNWKSIQLGSGFYTLSTPAYGVDNNTIYAVADYTGATASKLYALNATTGEEIWNVSVKRPDGTTEEIYAPYTPVLFYNNSTSLNLDDDVVCFGTWSNENTVGTYYVYNAADGSPIWNRTSTHNRGYYWAGAAPINQRYIVYGGDDGYLTAVDLQALDVSDEEYIGTGRIRSSVTWCPINETYGHLFFTNRTNAKVTKIGFDASTGDFIEDSCSRNIHFSTSTPTVIGDRVYVGGGNFSTQNNSMICLHKSNMSQEYWTYEPDCSVYSSPAVSIRDSDKYVYFTTNCKNGSFYCVNDSSEDLQWKFTTLEYGTTSGPNGTGTWYSAQLQGVAISDGWVYGGNDGGYTYGLSNVTPGAYGYEVGEDPNCGEPNNEFPPAYYAKIRVLDGDRAVNVTMNDDCYAAHRFTFCGIPSASNVTMINVTWAGVGHQDDDDNGADLYICNTTSGAYEFLQDGGTTDDEVVLTGGITSDISNYIQSGCITVMAKQKGTHSVSDRSWIETDYVNLIITVV